MQTIVDTLSAEVVKAAYNFEELRRDCKAYLARHGRSFDKFTVVGHDSFIGYITEHYLKGFLQNLYAGNGVEISTWEEQYDVAAIRRIIASDSDTPGDLNYMTEYFYDRYDLKLSRNGYALFVDIKTAYTQKEPSSNWNFLYPVVQAHKAGKDQMILSYYVVNDLRDRESLRKIVVVGCTSEDVIRTCVVVKAGQKTRFGTLSQIDNYETQLSTHYGDVRLLSDLLPR